MTAIIGVLISYGAALVTARSTLNAKLKSIVEAIALVINTIPGMVLGIAFMLTFTGTNLQSTFIILIICDVVHYFSTSISDGKKFTIQNECHSGKQQPC